MAIRKHNPDNACLQCGDRLGQSGGSSFFCLACSRARYNETGRAQAISAVSLAIKLGTLARPSTFRCADCGARAEEYDHRDYSKPLDVEPVCHRCNAIRGPGLWLKHTPLRDLLRGARKRVAA